MTKVGLWHVQSTGRTNITTRNDRIKNKAFRVSILLFISQAHWSSNKERPKVRVFMNCPYKDFHLQGRAKSHLPQNKINTERIVV